MLYECFPYFNILEFKNNREIGILCSIFAVVYITPPEPHFLFNHESVESLGACKSGTWITVFNKESDQYI